MEKSSKIYIAGHRGLVGGALVRALEVSGYSNLITKTKEELNLLDQPSVSCFFAEEKPEYVFVAAAKVGGILANDTYPADFIYENLQIQNNVIHNAHQHEVKKLLFLGSSCIYPKYSDQPISENSLLTGPLEPTNEAYAVAKIAGIKLCQNYAKQYGDIFISVMPTNLYGPGDNFHPRNSHVLPALLRRFHEAKEDNAKEVVVWGSGSPLREFLYVDDLASACIHLMKTYDQPEIVNIGTGTDISINELAETIKEVVGYGGNLTWDDSKPDGTPRKLLNVSKLRNLGWQHSVELKDGIVKTYEWYLNNLPE
jgi:GDP-L-fucose synthase